MVGGQRHAPADLSVGKSRYPLYRMLGGQQGRSWRVRKVSPPPGFDQRTVQPVASLCTDWALPAPTARTGLVNKSWLTNHLLMHGLARGGGILIQKCIQKFLFICGLYKDVVSSRGYLVSSVRTIIECWIGKNVVGNGCVKISLLSWRDWGK